MSSEKRVTKAVIPAAGHGTRLLPITKTVPKEILPLVDKPIIQLVVEELVEAGIENIIIVTSPRKAALVDYFGDVDAALVEHLNGASKTELLKGLEAVKNLANFAFVEQHGVYGTGTPVLCAEPYIGDEPFIYTFADDFFMGPENSFKQMIQTYEQYHAPVIASLRKPGNEDYKYYGYMGGQPIADHVTEVNAIVEQPGSKEQAPGDLASLGGFLVTPDVFAYLHQILEELPEGKEFYFNSALGRMVEDHKRVLAREITGVEYFDTGTKLAYMESSVAMAVRHPQIGPRFKEFLRDFVQKEYKL